MGLGFLKYSNPFTNPYLNYGASPIEAWESANDIPDYQDPNITVPEMSDQGKELAERIRARSRLSEKDVYNQAMTGVQEAGSGLVESVGGGGDSALDQAIQKRAQQVYGRAVGDVGARAQEQATKQKFSNLGQATALKQNEIELSQANYKLRREIYLKKMQAVVDRENARNGVIRQVFSVAGSVLGAYFGGPAGAAAGGAAGKTAGGAVAPEQPTYAEQVAAGENSSQMPGPNDYRLQGSEWRYK